MDPLSLFVGGMIGGGVVAWQLRDKHKATIKEVIKRRRDGRATLEEFRPIRHDLTKIPALDMQDSFPGEALWELSPIKAMALKTYATWWMMEAGADVAERTKNVVQSQIDRVDSLEGSKSLKDSVKGMLQCYVDEFDKLSSANHRAQEDVQRAFEILRRKAQGAPEEAS